jgi:hypothetical protein
MEKIANVLQRICEMVSPLLINRETPQFILGFVVGFPSLSVRPIRIAYGARAV